MAAWKGLVRSSAAALAGHLGSHPKPGRARHRVRIRTAEVVETSKISLERVRQPGMGSRTDLKFRREAQRILTSLTIVAQGEQGPVACGSWPVDPLRLPSCPNYHRARCNGEPELRINKPRATGHAPRRSSSMAVVPKGSTGDERRPTTATARTCAPRLR
jgi:hypothetical protein